MRPRALLDRNSKGSLFGHFEGDTQAYRVPGEAEKIRGGRKIAFMTSP